MSTRARSTRAPSRPLEVTYDDFTEDIAENRFLRTAIRRMLALPGIPATAAARLAHVDGRLAQVQVLRHGDVPPWQPTRLNERYHAALRLSEIVLAYCSAEPGPGGVEVAAFVVDMARVFEDFVGTALTEALRRFPGATHLQYPDHLDVPEPGHRPAIPMKVDVVHSVNGRPRLIFDAKYKASGPDERYPNADYYQMLAYCTALQVPTAWLVYAGGPPKPTRRRIRHLNVDVVEFALDLGAHPRDLLRQVATLVEEAWRSQVEQQPALSG